MGAGQWSEYKTVPSVIEQFKNTMDRVVPPFKRPTPGLLIVLGHQNVQNDNAIRSHSISNVSRTANGGCTRDTSPGSHCRIPEKESAVWRGWLLRIATPLSLHI